MQRKPVQCRVVDGDTSFIYRQIGIAARRIHVERQDAIYERLQHTFTRHGGFALPMSTVYRASDPQGPASRWMIERCEVSEADGRRGRDRRSDACRFVCKNLGQGRRVYSTLPHAFTFSFVFTFTWFCPSFLRISCSASLRNMSISSRAPGACTPLGPA